MIESIELPTLVPRQRIVSRFTTFNENFVICCYQVTKICSRYGFTCAFSARSPCDLGSPAYLAFPVFREVTINTVFSRNAVLTHSVGGSREELAGGSPCSGTLSSTRFSLNSYNHPGNSRNAFRRARLLSPFFTVSVFVVVSGNRSP